MCLRVLSAVFAWCLVAQPVVAVGQGASPAQLARAKAAAAAAAAGAAGAGTQGAAGRPLRSRGRLPQLRSEAQRQQGVAWWQALQQAIVGIHRQGAGGYSTADEAHEALSSAFVWSGRTQRLHFHEKGARPSFCSGAVYAAVLSALIRWDAAQQALPGGKRRISAEAWQALAPQRVADGVGAWGCANANGPGFAVLAHRLGAGVSFTEWEKARPSDVAKLWWNDKVGAEERGHLVILVRDEGDSVRVWSSHSPKKGEPGGFGFRTFPKSAIRRVLFTRITDPAAFNRAPSLGEDAWLMQLTQRNVSWEECLRRAGVGR